MAVVKISGKQFVVIKGKTITVPYQDLEVGEILKTKDLLTGKELDFEVVDQKRSDKTLVMKFRNKTRYQRVIGQRTKLTLIKNIQAEKNEKLAKVEKEIKEKSSAKKS